MILAEISKKTRTQAATAVDKALIYKK